MTKPVRTAIQCAACGREMGKVAGVKVTPDIICDDPICQYQDAPDLGEVRNSRIVAMVNAGHPVTGIAFQEDISRQRVYQIFKQWQEGI